MQILKRIKKWFLRTPDYMDIPLYMKDPKRPEKWEPLPRGDDVRRVLGGIEQYLNSYCRAMIFWCPEGHMYRVPRDHVSVGEIHYCTVCGAELICSKPTTPPYVKTRILEKMLLNQQYDPNEPVVQQLWAIIHQM